MKKLLFTLLTLGLLIPTTYEASTSNFSSETEFAVKKQKKKKSLKRQSSKSNSKKNSCTYNGYPLEVGPRGGCYYWSGNSKEYVDRSYCSGCN
ncbi:hypothetical protein PQ459_16405 [Chryseobacterium sp. KACC 21268]|nr:hypothetical protein PQ459_16405 [Chryseobacterium sp. KACC 21268]